jgi:hypothetical protein
MHDHIQLKKQFLHFDSINSTYITNVNNTSKNTNNAFHCRFAMNQTFRNVKNIHLTSVEMPIGFSNVRTGSTDTLKFTLNNTVYKCVLPEKNYSTIASLVSDLNFACLGVVPNVNIVFSLTASLTTPQRLVITFSGTSQTNSFNIIDTNLSKYILGFRNGIDSLVGSVYAASYSNYNLNADNYILLYIPTLNGMNSAMGGGVISSFKLPFNTIFGNIYYYQENTSFKQSISTTSSNLTVSDLTVIIYDKYGNNINPNGFNYSFSLTFDYEG